MGGMKRGRDGWYKVRGSGRNGCYKEGEGWMV